MATGGGARSLEREMHSPHHPLGIVFRGGTNIFRPTYNLECLKRDKLPSPIGAWRAATAALHYAAQLVDVGHGNMRWQFQRLWRALSALTVTLCDLSFKHYIVLPVSQIFSFHSHDSH